MFKYCAIIFASITYCCAKASLPLTIAPAPISLAIPAPVPLAVSHAPLSVGHGFITATSSQVHVRNYNGIVAPIVAPAPVLLAAPAITHYEVIAPLAAASPGVAASTVPLSGSLPNRAASHLPSPFAAGSNPVPAGPIPTQVSSSSLGASIATPFAAPFNGNPNIPQVPSSVFAASSPFDTHLASDLVNPHTAYFGTPERYAAASPAVVL